MLVSAAVLAIAPAAADAARVPLPPQYFNPPPGQMYVLAGVLSHYVPATASTDGKITLRVSQANTTAGFAPGMTLILRVNAATRVFAAKGLQRWFVRRHFVRPPSPEMQAAFFDGYAQCAALPDLFAWFTPRMLRDLERMLPPGQ